MVEGNRETALVNVVLSDAYPVYNLPPEPDGNHSDSDKDDKPATKRKQKPDKQKPFDFDGWAGVF